MKNIKTLLIAVSSFLFFQPFTTVAQWSTNAAVNNQICGLSGEQAIPKIATCANGDTYIGYFSNESGNYNVRLQRLDAQGNILWASNGILLSNTTAFNAAPKVVATSSGNIVVAWQADNVIIMQKITPAGSLLWGPAGITLTSANRMTWPQLLPVGTDEVIMKYFDDSGPINAPTRHVFAQRYNASGTAVWSSPAAISLAGGISAWTQIFPFINDGSDGFVRTCKIVYGLK